MLWRREPASMAGIALSAFLGALLLGPASPYRGAGTVDELAHQILSQKAQALVQDPLFLPAWLCLPLVGALAVWTMGPRGRRPATLLVLAFVLLNQGLQTVDFAPNLFEAAGRDTPPGVVLQSDNSQYKRIFHRMAQGDACYDAQFVAMHFHRGLEAAPTYALGYRMPGAFHLWGLLTGWRGDRLPVLFLAVSLACTLACYLLAARLLPAPQALLPAALVAPFFAYGLPGLHFLMMEYWAVFAWIPAVLFYQRRQDAWAAFFLSLSVVIREQMLVPAVALFVAGAVARPRHRLGLLALPAAVSLVALAAHVFTLSSAYPEIVPGGALQGYEGEGWAFMARLLQFNAPPYSQWPLLAPLVAGLAVLVLVRLPRDLQVLLGLPLVAFLAMDYLKGTGFRTYWAILTTPWILVLAGLFPLGLSAAPAASDAPPEPAGAGG